ncbi:MAG: hypothetical protein A2252_00955 [Elusimicrobia bacterium RIFOXYA2_FULL_39_19]|nr:MAG: hypothetical protein A2252_00955 [Elusimicrobia bacterium RIFOXYA2_FULL_39_19]
MAVFAKKRRTVFEIIRDTKLVPEDKLNKLEEDSKKSGVLLQQLLINQKLVEKTTLLRTLSQEWEIKVVDLSELELDSDVIKLIPKSVTKRHRVVPFAKEENILFIAMSDPRNIFAIEDIQLLTGYQIEPYFAMPEDIEKAFQQMYAEAEAANASSIEELADEKESAPPPDSGDMMSESKEVMEDLLSTLGDVPADELKVTKGDEKVDIMEVDASAPETEKLVNAILLEALRLKASDIHIEPLEKRFSIRYRVDGLLRKSSFKVPLSFKSSVIAKLKILSGSMNITERRRPQDGRIMLMARGKPIELRINIIPTVFGESAVMRILDRSSVRVSLEKLTFLPDTQEKIIACLDKPYGLILVCGPTGSGKSTTLYSALNFINTPDTKILTAENPVEYNLDGIMQMGIVPEIGVTFPDALRAFLRQDPDVIMVGEIRDQETGQIAMEAAMTGHLVLSTIHTNDAPTAVSRLSEMKIHSYLISSTLECVLAQRLVRRICEKCKVPDPNPPEELLKACQEYKVDLSKATFMKGEGCSNCMKTGYKGRLGVHELLVMDDDLRALILKEVASGPIKELAVRHGMRTLIGDGVSKAAMGLTTYSEVLSVAT